MNKTIKPTRIFLGVFFSLFGLNGLLMIFTGSGFIPMPPPSESFAPIIGGLFAAKFVMPIAKLIQLTAGLLLISNKYTNLAVVTLSPVIFSIVASHLVVADFQGLPFGIIALIAWATLAFSKKDELKVIFER